MNRAELDRLIAEVYNTDGDHPWERYPDNTVYRHRGSRKWFALVMKVPRDKLGLPGDGKIDVVNVKCDPITIGSMRTEPGIYPAYHMNKESWLTVALDGSAGDETVRLLLDMSFELTAPKRKKAGAKQEEFLD